MSVSNKKNKPSILIVDDERGTREVLAKFLRADYEVTLAEDGEIGLNDAASAVHSLYRLRLH